jgi:hypothetical protein
MLTERLRQMRPTAAWVDNYAGYVQSIDDNLVTGIGSELYCSDYMGGAGQELLWTKHLGRECPPKMHAAFSSSALVVNTFARWKQALPQLSLAAQTGFQEMRFEVKCPTGLNGTPPHLDVLATHSIDPPVAIESKCLEFLNAHRITFSSQYDGLKGSGSKTPYYDMIRRLRTERAMFQYLDAAQLIKHALGLANIFQGMPVVLLYLHWEPSNWQEFREFAQHRSEIAEFGRYVSGCRIRFMSMSYQELWSEWEKLEEPSWLRAHIKALAERYTVAV